MAYYLYLNWTHDKVGIHKAECNLCNYGKGIQSNVTLQNGMWIGPIASEEEATFVAKKLRRKTILKCSRCL